jgi:magnesium transporter
MAEQLQVDTIVDSLSRALLQEHPREAARRLEIMSGEDAAALLEELPPAPLSAVMDALSPSAVEGILAHLSEGAITGMLEVMDRARAAVLLSRLPKGRQDEYLKLPRDAVATELRTLLAYPPDTAGHLMDSRISTFRAGMEVERAVEELRRRGLRSPRALRVIDDEGRLQGEVDLRDLIVADPKSTLATIAGPVAATATPMDPRDDVVDKLEQFHLEELPVVDLDGHILGVIRHAALIDALKKSATADIQTMVGASRDERALSTSWFAVRKRMPWLQINLLTAFLAAAVVGLFEGTIAKVTALAVLLPVVAGQSGNAGAQALAVTMRGLALREIRVSHWLRVMRKEVNAGLWNGVSIAVTCAIGVYVWSGSVGLVLVIAASMVISMVAAGMAGALVPITLSRLGQDPAVASSIILTTVTDVVGFFSFLGIATALMAMLV